MVVVALVVVAGALVIDFELADVVEAAAVDFGPLLVVALLTVVVLLTLVLAADLLADVATLFFGEAALVVLMIAVAEELGAEGVEVMVICPAVVSVLGSGPAAEEITDADPPDTRWAEPTETLVAVSGWSRLVR